MTAQSEYLIDRISERASNITRSEQYKCSKIFIFPGTAICISEGLSMGEVSKSQSRGYSIRGQMRAAWQTASCSLGSGMRTKEAIWSK